MEIQVLSWNPNGTPAPNPAFDRRCRGRLEFIILQAASKSLVCFRVYWFVAVAVAATAVLPLDSRRRPFVVAAYTEDVTATSK